MVQASATNSSLVSMVAVSIEKQKKRTFASLSGILNICGSYSIVSLSSYHCQLLVVTAPIFMCLSESGQLKFYTFIPLDKQAW
jgi:hypothetical protein